MMEFIFLANNTITIISKVDNPNNYNYINVVVEDPYGVVDINGRPVKAPYMDPPPGGYQYEPADHLPFYWDNPSCDKCLPKYFKSEWIDGNYIKFMDSPMDFRLKENEVVKFKTTLVRMLDGTNYQELDTVSWCLSNKGLRLCQ